MGLKSRHVEKFPECRLTDVGESELTEKKMYAQSIRSRRVRRTGDLISNRPYKTEIYPYSL